MCIYIYIYIYVYVYIYIYIYIYICISVTEHGLRATKLARTITSELVLGVAVFIYIYTFCEE